MDVRESKDQKAGRNREQQRCVNLSMFLGRKEKAMNSWKIADPLVDNRRQPPLAPDDSMVTSSQDVVGLWLKYGVKSLKIETSLLCEILMNVATIC
jgi:hypothetical protein